MCGVSGVINRNKVALEKELRSLVDWNSHRGPDNSNLEIMSCCNFFVGLGHNRLSILDLTNKANQPMKFNHLMISYNGEIYNFKLIKNELEKFGYIFETESDTEVILKGYHKWNTDIFQKLRGMFSISIFDTKNNIITLARDRLGVKPLYYFFNGEELIFSSEMGGLLNLKKPEFKKNNKALTSYLSSGWNSGTETMIENIFKVPQGTSLSFSLAENFITKHAAKKYWDFPFTTENMEEEDIFSKISESIKLRLVSDVEVGCFLSGGIDSSVVASIASLNSKKIKTYSISFENDSFDESYNAKALSKCIDSDHQDFRFSEKDLIDMIPYSTELNNDLMNDESSLPMLLLSKNVSKELKVVLSGDGGDELFFGYQKYFQTVKFFKDLNAKKNLNTRLSSKIRKLLNLPFISPYLTNGFDYKESLESQKEYLSYMEQMHNFNGPKLSQTLFNRYENIPFQKPLKSFNDIHKDLRIFDILNYLPSDILQKVDLTSMKFGLEAREPLLDHELLEVALSAKSDLLFDNNQGKLILRNLLKRLVPEYKQPHKKKGFSVPIKEWLRGELKFLVEDLISEGNLKNDDLLNTSQILKYKNYFLKYGLGNQKFIWGLIQYFQWKEKWNL